MSGKASDKKSTSPNKGGSNPSTPSGTVTRLEDLAQLAGVSIATVSRALNDSPAVNENTKRRIWTLARNHNYHFRPHMPAVPSGAVATIAVVIPPPQGREVGLYDPFYLELIGGIGEAARESGCDLLLSQASPRNYDELAALMASNRADGIIFLGQSSMHEHLNRLATHEHRFVVWGAELAGQRYGSVGSDNLRGGRRAAAHLLRLGRRRLAFCGDVEAPEISQRYRGYRQALEEADLPLDPALVSPTHFEIESAQSAVDRMLAREVDFDAIVAASDQIAVGAARAIQRAGLRVPDDVSVVGYDDLYLARFASPALTTVRQDTRKAGRLLVSKLRDAPDAVTVRSERLPTDLIVRESCGA
ncbi:MAG: LacI family DNA-binding transcriptional regulator [Pseudomonadota bacterium]